MHRHSRQALIVFCNGWGMDDRPFRHLEADRCDVLMLWDYRQMTPVPDIVALAGQYAEIYLVGWSMGVWAGQRMFSPVREHFQAAIAVNGTLCPIHDRFGIPEATIAGTLRNFSEVSRDKLYLRMCRDRQGARYSRKTCRPAASLARRRSCRRSCRSATAGRGKSVLPCHGGRQGCRHADRQPAAVLAGRRSPCRLRRPFSVSPVAGLGCLSRRGDAGRA